MPSSDRVKGLVLTSRRDWVQRTYGRPVWDRLLVAVPPESKETLAGTIRANDWYPLRLNEDLDWAICRELAGGDRTIFRRLGRHTADLIVKTSYSRQVEDRDPAGFLATVGKQAPRYYDGLGVRSEVLGPTHVVLHFSGITSNEPNCESNIGYYERGVEICGGNGARGRETACTGKGEPEDLYDFTWRAVPGTRNALGAKAR